MCKETTTHCDSLSSTSTAGFDPELALAWRSTNFALQKAIEVLDHVLAQFQSTYDMCMAVCDGGMVSLCQVCSPLIVLVIVTENDVFPIMLAIDISKHLHAEIVDDQDGNATAEQDNAIYENVITIHGNIINKTLNPFTPR